MPILDHEILHLENYLIEQPMIHPKNTQCDALPPTIIANDAVIALKPRSLKKSKTIPPTAATGSLMLIQMSSKQSLSQHLSRRVLPKRRSYGF